jgi:hypothetical protein
MLIQKSMHDGTQAGAQMPLQENERGEGVRENVQENGENVALTCGSRLQCH